jgi:hypothetical protein
MARFIALAALELGLSQENMKYAPISNYSVESRSCSAIQGESAIVHCG